MAGSDSLGKKIRAAKVEKIPYMNATGRNMAMSAIVAAMPDVERDDVNIVAAEALVVASRVDPVLFALSYDYVGDLAETISLVWPHRPGA